VDRGALGQMPVAGDSDPIESRWIVAELSHAAQEVDEALAAYRFDDAANAVYQFFWGDFCDWYLEIVKLRLDFSESGDRRAAQAALTTLLQTFETALRLLSPFMPFITEELWHALYEGEAPAKSIALTRYPQRAATTPDYRYEPGVLQFSVVQSVVTTLRALRKDNGVPEREVIDARIYCPEAKGSLTYSYLGQPDNIYLCERLARVRLSLVLGDAPPSSRFRSAVGFDAAIDFEQTVDVAAERERLTKELARQEKILASAEKQLNNPAFLGKAPAHIVEGLRKQEAEARGLLEKTRRALEELG